MSKIIILFSPRNQVNQHRQSKMLLISILLSKAANPLIYPTMKRWFTPLR